MKFAINPNRNDWSDLLRRPTQTFENIEMTVNEIFSEVRQRGDASIKAYTETFDDVTVKQIKVTPEEIDRASSAILNDLKSAIQLAKANITAFHEAQKTDCIKVTTTQGVVCWQEKRAIQKVGLYIPGGTAPLFSTVLMLAIPAQIAGVSEIVLCSPPNKSGNIPDEVLYTAQLCGISKIFKVGGIQAIAGLTFGTESIPKVNKIFGPGNQFVTTAKQIATKFGVAIDMPAGPSELLIVADETSKAQYIAADLLSQAEHGTDSQVILVANSKQFMETVKQEVERQLVALPRQTIAKKVMDKSRFISFNSKTDTLDFINAYAPEHLILCTSENDFYATNVVNAGSVFIGNFSPESAGDYASGTNHTLPTNGYSKAYSGVNLDSFSKSITFQEISEQGLVNIGNAIEVMAEAEGLQAHKNAVSMRLADINLKRK